MGNSIDEMKKAKQKEAFSQFGKNSTIDACCSVDDLRCHLNNMQPETLEKKREAQNDITSAIMHEVMHQGRITVKRMLEAKWKSIQRSIK